MNSDIIILSITAASIGFMHTLLGPDHYLPFIVMSRARGWSMMKTLFITLFCGLGHILSSVVIGLGGIFFGVAVMKLEALEAFRGNIAAWCLMGFGLAYFVWGLHRATQSKPHKHVHYHADGSTHKHEHSHTDEHSHLHEEKGKSLTPWVLFVIFILGPCEPLIPLLMYPAAQSNWTGVITVALIFGFVTISTMLAIVMATAWGVSFTRLGRLEKYTHALAGGTIFISGIAIQFLGL